MIAVIIAGGAGSRLWPLSTHNYPKQLLKVNNDQHSLLQNTYNRAKQMAETVYVLPETRLVEHVQQQIPELTDQTLIVEPALRGTASCVLAALAHVAQFHDADEPVAILWSDHYIRDTEGFVHSFKVAAETSAQEGRLVLVGVEPTYPATGFGYIHKGDVLSDEQFVFNVSSFKEKPAFDIAQEYFRSGEYLWNAGYVVGSINTFKNTMQQYTPELLASYEALVTAPDKQAYMDTYLAFPNETIDRALSEKVENFLVAPASFDWLDLGSFADLSKAVTADEKGNYVFGKAELEEVNNTFVHNSEDKPVAVIGLDNVVVVNTPEGILVAPKDLSQKVGDISKRFK